MTRQMDVQANYQNATMPGIAEAVTPNNSTTFTPSALFVGTGGDLKVDMADSGTEILFKNIANGTFMPGRYTRVYSTDTDASNIVRMS